MALTFVQNGSNSADASTNSVTVTLGQNVGSGNLVIVWMKWEGGSATPTLSGGGGGSWVSRPVVTNTFTWACHGYILAAAGGAATVTMTLDVNQTFKHFHVWEYSYSGTCSFLADGTFASVLNTTDPRVSNDITINGTDLVCLAGYGEDSGATISSMLINGVAPDASIVNSPAGTFTASWAEKFTTGFTGHSSFHLDANGDYIAGLIAFGVTGGGGSPQPVLGSFIMS